MRYPVLLVGSLLLGSACSADGADFDARYAPSFAQGAHASVSILGIYRDGRMNVDTWDEVGPTLSPWLGKDRCDIAYNAELVATHEELASAIDEVTRRDGVTDGILDAVSPMAEGDLVMLVTMDGKPQRSDANVPHDSPGAPAPGMNGRGHRNMGSSPGAGAPRAARGVPPGTFEMTASLFSRREKKTVALVAMKYTGASFEEARQRFVNKVKVALPGLACVGWKEAPEVTPEKVRSAEE